MRILVSAGGTGGGIYPALAVADAIRKINAQAVLHFVGSATGLENELIKATGTEFDAYDSVQAGPLHGVNPLRAFASLVRLKLGTAKAILLFFRQKPDSVFLTGGWVGLPVAIAATLFRVPIIIYVPDIEPGLTLKVLGRLARIITATTEDTRTFFPNKRLVATGYPLRADLMEATPEAGMQRFELDLDRPVLLVFGGSRGARSINRAVLASVETLLAETKVQIIHVTGSLDWEEVRNAHKVMSGDIRARYRIFEYLHDIGLAMAASDLVLSRAGASTLGEFPYFHLPSILVPYPYAWRYQKVNADWLVSRGAAMRLEDERLEGELLTTLVDLINSPAQLAAMRDAAAELARASGAENVARVILEPKNVYN